MSQPFPMIPPTATPFLIQDSYPITVQPGNEWPFSPGMANTDGTFTAGQTVTAWVAGAELELIPAPGATEMFGVDALLEIYDTEGGIARPTGVILTMASPYGAAPNGMILSAASSGVIAGKAGPRYSPEMPAVLRTQAPLTGGPFRIGSRLLFHSPVAQLCEYLYYLQGAWQAQ